MPHQNNSFIVPKKYVKINSRSEVAVENYYFVEPKQYTRRYMPVHTTPNKLYFIVGECVVILEKLPDAHEGQYWLCGIHHHLPYLEDVDNPEVPVYGELLYDAHFVLPESRYICEVFFNFVRAIVVNEPPSMGVFINNIIGTFKMTNYNILGFTEEYCRNQYDAGNPHFISIAGKMAQKFQEAIDTAVIEAMLKSIKSKDDSGGMYGTTL